MSRQLDSMLKGLSIFREGVQSAMQNKAISDATSQAEILRANTELDAEEKVNQLDALASDLRLRLMQRGASAQKAETAGASIGMTPYQREVMGIQRMNAEKKAQADPFKIADLRFKQQKFVRDLANDFEDQTKGLMDKIQSGRTAAVEVDTAIQKGNPIAASALPVTIAGSKQPGNLSEKEVSVFKGKQDLLSQAKRIWDKKIATGMELTVEDLQYMKQYVETLNEANVGEFNRLKSSYINSQKDALLEVGLEPEKFGKNLDERFDFKLQSPQPPPADSAIQKLEAALKQYPNRREEILKKIQELKKARGM